MTAPVDTSLDRTFEGFSLSHAAILGANGLEGIGMDIYGVRTASLAPDTGSYDNTGDDFVLSSWFWINFATVTVESGYIPFNLQAILSGAPVSSPTVSETNPEGTVQTPLWDQDSANQAARPMLIRIPSRNADGASRTMDFVLYKVIFSPISFTGPAYKDGLLVSYTGRAVLSNKDETGTVLGTGNPNGTKRAIGRLINRPVPVL